MMSPKGSNGHSESVEAPSISELGELELMFKNNPFFKEQTKSNNLLSLFWFKLNLLSLFWFKLGE